MSNGQIVYDLQFAEYQRWPSVHSGLLNAIAKSPLHGKHFADCGKAETPALLFGRNSHFACLQPDVWRSCRAIAPDVDRRTKDGKSIWAAFQAQAGDKLICSRSDADAIDAMVDAVWRHEVARDMLSMPGGVEVSLRWTDRETGLPCKARLDKVCGDSPAGIVDLKTAMDEAYYPFSSSAVRYGYHRQAAWYRRGWRECGGDCGQFSLIAVEKSPPYDVAVYDMMGDDLDIIDRQLQELLRAWADCVSKGQYRGTCNTRKVLVLPEWAIGGEDREPITLDGEAL